MNKPTFIGIGGQKCGSTWLSECLRSHPNIQMSTPKELRYFTDNREKGLDWYLSHFQKNNIVHRGEFSSNYIYYPELAEKIHDEVGSVKIIGVLREPVERCLSHIKHLIRDGKLDPPSGVLNRSNLLKINDDFPKLINNSLYFRGLDAFGKVFGESNVFYVSQADCRSKPNLVLSSLWNFLRVTKDVEIPETNKTISEGIVPRYQWLETWRRELFSIAKGRFPGAINAAKKTGLSAAYRKYNRGNELKFSNDACEYIYGLCKDDWERTLRCLKHF